MSSYAGIAKRGEGRLWAAALGLSLLCNAALLVVAGMAFVQPLPFEHSAPHAAETLRFITPQLAAPASEPAATAAAAAKAVLAPGHDPGFARTSDDQRGKRPDHPVFIGERDTEATSDATPDPNAPAMPAQSGIQPRHAGDFETTESYYQDGTPTDSTAPASQAPPATPATTAALGATTPAPRTADALAGPVTPGHLAEGPKPVDLPVPLSHAPDPTAAGPEATQRSGAPDALPAADALKEAKATHARPDPLKDPAFRGNQRKTAIQGAISRRGRSALDVADSPLGRYQASIGRAVELEWQRNLMRNRDLVTPGYLTVRFFVDAKGKVRNVQCVGVMQTGQLQKSFTLKAIREAAIPAMSAELGQEFEDEPLELTFNFYF
ncbi:MAG: hypothetical protein DVB25_01845 [Verrucomicrobia bacterium]|nr:MAG: hypothetical protein DVB25_01845 [Verrucomicrobiota bacterium]